MNSALTRKAWVLTRRLLGEFWDNCKIKPDTRILYGYVDRSLRSGFHESDILSAFERALHECHGHATDVGQVWEASSTAHRAEALLKRCQGRWRPLTADEQAELRARIESSLASGSPPVAVEPVLTPLPEASRNSSRKKENEPIPPEQWPSPTQIRATFNAFRQAAGLPTRRDIP